MTFFMAHLKQMILEGIVAQVALWRADHCQNLTAKKKYEIWGLMGLYGNKTRLNTTEIIKKPYKWKPNIWLAVHHLVYHSCTGYSRRNPSTSQNLGLHGIQAFALAHTKLNLYTVVCVVLKEETIVDHKLCIGSCTVEYVDLRGEKPENLWHNYYTLLK